MLANINVDTLNLPYFDGTGNDFFIYDARMLPADVAYADLARYICDRHGSFGGADGLLVIGHASDLRADVEMRIYNADGSEAEMCGNGARCAVRYLLESAADRVTLQTLAGLIRGEVVSRHEPFIVKIDIGEPTFTGADLGIDPQILGAEDEARSLQLAAAGHTWTFDGVSFGNPHIVCFVPDVELIDVGKLGPRFERTAMFLHGTNVHFAQVLDRTSLRVRHWERGSGATLACGTGAAAAAVAAIRRGLIELPVRVFVPGGELGVAWLGANAELSGPALRHSIQGDA